MNKWDTTNFGNVVGQALTARSMTQRQLGSSMGVANTYVSHMMTGYRKPSPKWADLIADTLQFSDAERQKLHEAAAKDHGFKLDLTKK